LGAPLPRRLVAEAVGTAMLVLFGAGSMIAALTAGDGSLDYAGLKFVSLTFGIVVALVIYGFGPVSGAHINPAVTLALGLTRRFAWREVAPCMVAQLVGATFGAALVTISLDDAPQGYQAFDKGAATKYVIDPHGMVA
jgi:glycerol uptake facilitator protein